MIISVIIPTYRRPNELAHCLDVLRNQKRPPDEILAVVRDSDEETQLFLKRYKTTCSVLKVVIVNSPGQVTALNAGLDNAKGDIIVFTDDDTVARSDWLKRIEEHFKADPKVGGVGGRDWCYIDGKLVGEKALVVGRLFWFGLLTDGHHLGVGKSRLVDHLKGANMSFRREALSGIRFDERLRGTGAQFRNELAVCLAVKHRGWKIIYDPQVAISHYYSERYDEDQRGKFNPVATENMAFNETLVLLEHLSAIRRIIYIIWALLVGNRGARGVALFIRAFVRGKRDAWPSFVAALRGRWEGWKTWKTSGHVKR